MASARVPKSSTAQFGQLARPLPSLPPLQGSLPHPHSHSHSQSHSQSHSRRQARRHLQVLGAVGDPLPRSSGESQDAGKDARLRPPASLFGTNPSKACLSRLAEGSTDHVSQDLPGDLAFFRAQTRGLLTSPGGPTYPGRSRPERQLPPLPNSPASPNQRQRWKAKSHGSPSISFRAPLPSRA